MRASITFFLSLATALQIPSNFAPFYEPQIEESPLMSNETFNPLPEKDLRKRAGNCPANYNSCSTLAKADAGACCGVGSVCTLDRAKNVACCPIGALCTGTIQIATATATITTGTGGAAFIFGSSTTTTTSFNIAASTTSSSASTITAAVSYVPNTYGFSFPYIPTSYPNSADCNSAYNDCQANYAACTVDLQGGNGIGVTIVAPGGGTTVAAGGSNLGVASATSICSSLSSAACYGLVTQNCVQFDTNFVVSTTKNGGVPRPTARCMEMVWAGVGLGIAAGQMI